jgi:predicted DNA-binding ribbon-helix-helix protein
MQSAVVKRSIVIAGHKTSVSLEDEFWSSLKEIGKGNKTTLSKLVADIDMRRPHRNLSSAIRLFVLDHFRSQIAETSTHRIGAGMATPRVTEGARPSHQANGGTGEHAEQ